MPIDIIASLTTKNDVYSCSVSDTVISESRETDEWYGEFDRFAALLDDKKSLVRNRAIGILAALAQWDDENKFEAILPRFLAHILDEKPITARQCIKSLATVAEAKPKLIPSILASLDAADTSKYKDSMRPLIDKDIAQARESLAGILARK